MVYRILPKRHSRVEYFLRPWCLCLLFFALILLMLSPLFDTREDMIELVLVGVACSTLAAWSACRAWGKLGWYDAPVVSFLTVVEEGLLLESPERGVSLYLPWQWVSVRRRGYVMLIQYQYATVAMLSLKGLPRARQNEIADALKRHAGKAPAPQAPLVPGLPSIPRAPLPPPALVKETSPAFFTNTPEQWKEGLRFSLRPDKAVCALLLAVIAYVGFVSGETSVQADDAGVTLVCLLIYLVFAGAILYRLVRPSLLRQRRLPGCSRLTFTSDEFVSQMSHGAWARFRLPEKGEVVQLPHCRCLKLGVEQRVLSLDAGGELPPALAAYPTRPAPGNRLRVFMALLLMVLGYVGGLFYGSRPTEAELAFRALPASPDEETLRAFAARYYAHGEVLDTPILFACTLDEEEQEENSGEGGYMLCFTDSAPDPDEDDGKFHLAWVTSVMLYPSGRVYEKDSWHVHWCPCDWVGFLMEEESDEEDDAEEAP